MLFLLAFAILQGMHAPHKQFGRDCRQNKRRIRDRPLTGLGTDGRAIEGKGFEGGNRNDLVCLSLIHVFTVKF